MRERAEEWDASQTMLCPTLERYHYHHEISMHSPFDGTNGAPVDLGASNGGVETEDWHAGGRTWSYWLAEEIELLICSAGGCVMVCLMILFA